MPFNQEGGVVRASQLFGPDLPTFLGELNEKLGGMTDPWELPAGWRWTTMGEVAKVVGGSTPKTGEPSYWGGDIPWITPDDLSGFTAKHIEHGRRSITKAGYDSCSTQLVPAGTVLFTSRAPIGYVAIAANAVCTNQGFKSFICHSEMDPNYLYWYLTASRDLARSLASGTTFLELSARRASMMPVAVPPLTEQRRIVETLEARVTQVDGAHGNLSAAVHRIAAWRSSVISAVFSDRETRPLSEIADVVRGVTYDKADAQLRPADGLVPLLRATNINHSLNFDGLYYVPEKYVGAEQFLRVGDIVCASSSGSLKVVGKAAALDRDWRGTFGAFCTVVRPRADVHPAYLARFMESQAYRRRMSGLAAGVNINNLRRSHFANTPVPWMDRDAQLEAVAQLDRGLAVADRLAASVNAALRKAAALRQAALFNALGRGAAGSP